MLAKSQIQEAISVTILLYHIIIYIYITLHYMISLHFCCVLMVPWLLYDFNMILLRFCYDFTSFFDCFFLTVFVFFFTFF